MMFHRKIYILSLICHLTVLYDNGKATSLLDDRSKTVPQPRDYVTSYGALDALPEDVICHHILPHCDENILKTNLSFFTLITGYSADQIFLNGPTHPPSRRGWSLSEQTGKKINFRHFKTETEIETEKAQTRTWSGWIRDKVTNPSSWFKKQTTAKQKVAKYDIQEFEQMPSFIWYCLMTDVCHLPPTYWPYLKGTKIIVCDLRNDQVGDEGLKKLIKNLIGTKITHIFLDNNQIGDEGALSLIQNLKETKLQGVYLSRNKISDLSLKTIPQHLKGSDIFEIVLDKNSITDVGAKYLIENLKFKHPLGRLSLIDNNISDEAATEISANFDEIDLLELEL